MQLSEAALINLAAKKALPHLTKCMSYTQLLTMDKSLLEALCAYESLRVEKMDEANPCLDGYTSGHHRDLLELLCHAAMGSKPSDIGCCWVYMDNDQLIQLDELIDSLTEPGSC